MSVATWSLRLLPVCRRPDGLGEVALDGHVDILVLDLEVEAAVFDLARDVIEAGPDVFGVFLGDDVLLG